MNVRRMIVRRKNVRRKSVIRMNVNKRRSARARFGRWHPTGDVCVNVKFL
jgi:hypothetical protein